jgi:uncharacterized protein YraI
MTAKIAVSAANLRSGPGTAYDRLGILATGDVVSIVGRTGDGSWLKVEVDQSGQSGWILARLVETPESMETLPILD